MHKKKYMVGVLTISIVLNLICFTSSSYSLNRSDILDKSESTVGVAFWDEELDRIMEYSLNYTIGEPYSYMSFFKRQNITLYFENESIEGFLAYYKKSQVDNAVLYFHGLGCNMNNQKQYLRPFLYNNHLVMMYQQPEHHTLMFEQYNQSYQYYNLVLAIMYYRILCGEITFNNLWTSGHSFGGQLAMYMVGILNVSQSVIYSSSFGFEIIRKYPSSSIWEIINLSSPRWDYMKEYAEPWFYLNNNSNLLICIGEYDEYFPLEMPLSQITRANYSVHIYNNQGHFLTDFVQNVKEYLKEEVHEKVIIY